MSSILTLYSDLDVTATDAGKITVADVALDSRMFNLPGMLDWWDTQNPALMANFGSDVQGTGGSAQWIGRKAGYTFTPRNDTGPYVKANAWNSLSSVHWDETGRDGELWCSGVDLWGADTPADRTIVWVGRAQSSANAALIASGDPTNYTAIRQNTGETISYIGQNGSGTMFATSSSYDPAVKPHTGLLCLDRTGSNVVMRINGTQTNIASSVSVWPLSGARMHLGGAGSSDSGTAGAQVLTLRGEMQFVAVLSRALNRAENSAALAQIEADLRARYATW